MDTRINDVITNLEALASGAGNQDADVTYSFYEIASNQLETQEEREAFRYGALAVLSEMAKHRIRAWYYTHLFRRAIKRLKEVNANE